VPRVPEGDERMRVGTIGAGRIGGNVGTQLARSGHEVLFSGSRDRARLERLAGGAPHSRAGAPREAVEFAEVLVLAVPWPAVDDALGQAGSLAGKVVIDATNHFARGRVESLPEGLSAVEVNARRMPGARVAKAFNTLTAGFQRDVAEGRVEGEMAMFFATEDDEAAEVTATLIAACRFVPVRIGGWDRVRLMEAPRRPGAVYGEAYRPEDAERIASAAAEHLDEAARLADELRLTEGAA
jgi:8-hydroxy-5-deazaflavin:NADPH oxidoreductase